jgi:L-aspartate oxidase
VPSLAAADVDAVATGDVLVVGGGLAGLTAALGLAHRRVTLATKGRLGRDGASRLAQGGIAAAVGPDDGPALHAADTLAVGGGLCDPGVVRLLADAAPEAVRGLAARGARFDRAADGSFALGREAAHSRSRILHASGDATGAELVRALLATPAARRVTLEEETRLLELVRERERVAGAILRRPDGERVLHLAPAVVLATGGIGRLYFHTTNPPEATGDGLAAAARAGARLIDLEFVQFHPTALAAGGDPLPLLSEALRGAGAVLVDGRGRRFLPEVDPRAELAPRDVVARAIRELRAAGEEAFLDAREAIGDAFPDRFPTAFAACRAAGIDPRREPIPVTPAAHYHMGGIEVDGRGRSSLPGLWAAGEAACTGAHGANRLASNSLLEAVVFGARVAADVADALANLPPARALLGDKIASSVPRSVNATESTEATLALRRLLWDEVGLVRNEAGLRRALSALDGIADAAPPEACDLWQEIQVGKLLAAAALERRESRGGHFRSDFPTARPEWQYRLALSWHDDGAAGRIAFERRPVTAGALAAGLGS